VKLGEELLAIADRESSSTSTTTIPTTPTLLPHIVLRIHSYVAIALTRLRRLEVELILTNLFDMTMTMITMLTSITLHSLHHSSSLL
jgi:hypothetical protein